MWIQEDHVLGWFSYEMALEQALEVLRWYDEKSSIIAGLRTHHVLVQDNSYGQEQRGGAMEDDDEHITFSSASCRGG